MCIGRPVYKQQFFIFLRIALQLVLILYSADISICYFLDVYPLLCKDSAISEIPYCRHVQYGSVDYLGFFASNWIERYYFDNFLCQYSISSGYNIVAKHEHIWMYAVARFYMSIYSFIVLLPYYV